MSFRILNHLYKKTACKQARAPILASTSEDGDHTPSSKKSQPKCNRESTPILPPTSDKDYTGLDDSDGPTLS